MPRVTRKPKLHRAGYHDLHVLQLQRGYDMFGDAFGNDDDFDAEAAKVAWGFFRETLLADWIKQQPGTRPAAWWWWESSGPRERVDGIQHPFSDRVRRQRIEALPPECFVRRHANDLSFGVPRVIFTKQEATAQYESEAAYLKRHGLLTPAEVTELFS